MAALDRSIVANVPLFAGMTAGDLDAILRDARSVRYPKDSSVFDQGTVNSGTLSDGRAYSYLGFNRPGSILVTEAFLIEGGKIRRVEMIGPAAVYHMNSPWGGLSGN